MQTNREKNAERDDKSRQKVSRLEIFTEKTGLLEHNYSRTRILTHFDHPDLELFAGIVNLHRTLLKSRLGYIANNCLPISRSLLESEFANYIIYCDDIPETFIHHDHNIPVVKTPMETHMAVDMTAGYAIYSNQGPFDSLCIHADSQEKLLHLVSELYSGKWSVREIR